MQVALEKPEGEYRHRYFKMRMGDTGADMDQEGAVSQDLKQWLKELGTPSAHESPSERCS